MQENFVITTPLYYANAAPHIGTAYTTVLANTIANWQSLSENKAVTLLTGLDEHGRKIEQSSKINNIEPQAFVDKHYKSFIETWKALGIQHELFVRTTSQTHKEFVVNKVKTLIKKGLIYKSVQRGKYCVGCEEFKFEKDLIADNKCPNHQNQEIEITEEENWFFKLSAFENSIKEIIQNDIIEIQPPQYKKEILSFITNGIKDISISRRNTKWGIEFPNDPEQVLYVWFDALLGYNSSGGYDKVNVHLVGKDIIKFHAIYYVGMLLATGIPLFDTLLVNGFITNKTDDTEIKIGKSNGAGSVLDLIQTEVQPEALKWWFCKEKNIGNDFQFNVAEIKNVANVDLGDKIGNLFSRVEKLYKKNQFNDLFSIKRNSDIETQKLQTIKIASDYFNRFELSKGFTEVVKFAEYLNNKIEETKPWKLAKENKDEYESIIVSLFDSIFIIGEFLSIIVPETAKKILLCFETKDDSNFNSVVTKIRIFPTDVVWNKL